MSFLENTMATAKDVLEIATERTEHAIAVQKKKFEIQKQKKQVAKCFEKLGRCYYDSQKNADVAEDLPLLSEEAALELSTYRELKRELKLLQEEE